MRFSTVFAVCALSSAAAASTLTRRQASYPDCAIPCVVNAPTGDCGSNIPCLCKDPNFVSTTTICIQKACTGNDLETAEKLSRDQCAAVGVTLTQTSFSSTTDSAAASSSATDSASSPAGSSSASTSSGNGAASTTGTGTSVGNSAGSTGTGSTSSATSTTPTGSGSGSAPATTPTGAASSRTISTFALVGAVALGALAL